MYLKIKNIQNMNKNYENNAVTDTFERSSQQHIKLLAFVHDQI